MIEGEARFPGGSKALGRDTIVRLAKIFRRRLRSTDDHQHRRPRVLLLAFACCPGKGLEARVGWNWAVETAAVYDRGLDDTSTLARQ